MALRPYLGPFNVALLVILTQAYGGMLASIWHREGAEIRRRYAAPSPCCYLARLIRQRAPERLASVV